MQIWITDECKLWGNLFEFNTPEDLSFMYYDQLSKWSNCRENDLLYYDNSVFGFIV